ncbi:MAG TPA: hypothetical protein VF294_15510, partial [Polyangiaceae bacterium]
MNINRKRQSDSQPALDAQTSAQEAQPTRRPFGAFSLQRVALACCGLLGTCSLLALAGCPANLEDPQRFDVQGNGGASAGGAAPGGGTSTGGAAVVVPAPQCVIDLFTPLCTTCHATGSPPSLGAG